MARGSSGALRKSALSSFACWASILRSRRSVDFSRASRSPTQRASGIRTDSGACPARRGRGAWLSRQCGCQARTSVAPAIRSREHAGAEERRERPDIGVDAGRLEGCHVGGTVFYLDNRPRVATSNQQGVHQEARHAAVAIGIRVDVTEQPVSKDRRSGPG